MKILKNKRGFSLVELMVVVAIMGVLSAIAIPSYLTYQKSARQGVVESMLYLVKRTVAIEEARGISTTAITGVNLWNRIDSEATGSFGTPSFTAAGTKWCFLTTTGTDDYAGIQGCMDSLSKSPVVVGVDGIDCADLKTYDSDSTSTVALACPAGCDAGAALNADCVQSAGATAKTSLVCTNQICS